MQELATALDQSMAGEVDANEQLINAAVRFGVQHLRECIGDRQKLGLKISRLLIEYAEADRSGGF